MCSDIRQSGSGGINCAKELLARCVVTAVIHSLALFLCISLLSARPQPNSANMSRQKVENSGMRGGTALGDSIGRKGKGVDGDVRFNSQQRGEGGGREIKISRNKRT